ncbi:MAG: hypothetical protein ACRC4N_00655, partial [Gammaproteobacteria bacterium]
VPVIGFGIVAITTSGVHYFSNNFDGLESRPHLKRVQMIYFICHVSYFLRTSETFANSKTSF